MSQRESGYQRKVLDQYETPAWVTRALIRHLPEFIGKIWKPACSPRFVRPLPTLPLRASCTTIRCGVRRRASGGVTANTRPSALTVSRCSYLRSEWRTND
jgi:hypothetical protein